MATDDPIDDPLVGPASEGPDRLNYTFGMMLDADAFAEEQRYHRGRLARALRYLFGTGTIVGLRVDALPVGDPTTEIRVTAGLAIDPLGRLLEVPRALCVALPTWLAAVVADPEQRAALDDSIDADEATVDVFARFCNCPRRLTPAIATGPYDALDAVAPSRLRDGVEVFLAIRSRADRPLPEAPVAPAWNDPLDRQRRLDNGWREGTDRWTTDSDPPRPDALPEHGADVDPTAVLLARLTLTLDTSGPAPVLAAASVVADNTVRRMVPAIGLMISPSLGGAP